MKRIIHLLLISTFLFSCTEPKKQENTTSQPSTTAPPPVTVEQPTTTQPEQPIVTPTPEPLPAPEVEPVEEDPTEATVPQAPLVEAPAAAVEEIKLTAKAPSKNKPEDKPAAPLLRTNLRAVADFTKGFPKNFRAHIKRETAIQVAPLKTNYHGEPLARFELTAEDIRKGAVRAEMLFTDQKEPIQWVGYALWIPTKDWEIKEPTADIITQWHSWEDKHLKEKPQVPPMALYIVNGQLGFMINWDDAQVTTPERRKAKGYKKTFNLGPAPVGKFTKFVYNIKFSHKTDGYVKLWLDDKLVIDYKGPNTYHDKDPYPYLKWGIYKRKFPKAPKRSLFFTTVRIAGSKGKYADVAP